jgi:ribonuclease D
MIIGSNRDLSRLISSWKSRNISRLALDFEGESNLHRYGIHLCLIQAADGESVHLIDPLADMNLSPLFDFFEDESVAKVMFSADFDVRLIHHTHGVQIRALRDIQIAGKLLDLEKNDLKSVLSAGGIKDPLLPSGGQKANWFKRPISDSLQEYAAQDVVYLLDAEETLSSRLIQKDLFDNWLDLNTKLEASRFNLEGMSHSLTKKLSRMNDKVKTRAERLYNLRERLAEEMDFPPFKLFSNDLLIQLAKHPPSTVQGVLRKKGMHYVFSKHREDLAEALDILYPKPSDEES